MVDLVITVRITVQLVVREEHAIRHQGNVNVQRGITHLNVHRSVQVTVLPVLIKQQCGKRSGGRVSNVWKVIMEVLVQHHVQKTVKVNVTRTLDSVTSVEKVIMEIHVSRSAATTV